MFQMLERLVIECEEKFKYLLPKIESKKFAIKFSNGNILK